jgi:hypothetical protein
VPNVNAIQAAFTGGEISPKLVGRVDADLYKKALRYCSDFEPLPYGSLKMRGGTRFQVIPGYQPEGDQNGDLTPDCRIIEFPVTGMQSKSLVLGNGLVRVYDETGQVVNGSTDLVKNGGFYDGWAHWTTRAAFIEGPRKYLGTTDVNLDGNGPAVWQTIPITPGTYDLKVRITSGALMTTRLQLGTADGLVDLLDVAHAGGGALPKDITESFTVPLGCTEVFFKLYTYSLALDVFLTPGGAWASAELGPISIPVGSTGPVEFTSPWGDDQLEAVQFVADASKDRMFFVHPEVEPQELAFAQDTGVWTFSEIVFTQPTDARWGTGDNGFPAAIELYDGRLWVGGIPGKVNSIIASRAGSIFDFTIADTTVPPTIVASDPIELALSTKGAILWIQGSRSLLIGTDRGEVSMTGSPLSALDFQARPESAFGSAPVQGLAVGDQAIYVSRDRRKVRALNFNLQENGFQSRDLTFVAEHLTRNEIRELAWAQDPNDTLVALLRDGTLIACIYNRAEQVVAWYRMNVGTVYSIMAANGPLGSELRMLVQRGEAICLEVLPMYEDFLPYNFDGSVAANAGGTTSAYVGQHLAGQTVGVIADGGTTHPDCLVDASGYITLNVAAEYVHAGLRFSPRATLLPFEGGGAKGTSQGAKRRRVRLYLKLNDSAIPLVNGERPFPDRSIATPLDSPEARMTGDVMTNMLGFDDGGAITIEQDVAIRTEILAVFGSVEVSES